MSETIIQKDRITFPNIQMYYLNSQSQLYDFTDYTLADAIITTESVRKFGHIVTNVIGSIRQFIKMIVPVRSGYLVDKILTSLKFLIGRSGLGHLYYMLSYKWPVLRDKYIKNPKHISKTGVGMNYTPQNAIPNAIKVGETKSGEPIYSLNDPLAEADANPLIENESKQ